MAFVAFVVVVLVSWRATPGTALPVFTHQYQVSCSKCHTVIPHLNDFGNAFMANGYRIPGVQPGNVIPISAKGNLVDSSENQGEGPGGAGLPKFIVDEVEVFAAGGIGTRASYLVEQYLVDGGMPGLLRDAWVEPIDPQSVETPRSRSDSRPARSRCRYPSIPETFRETVRALLDLRSHGRRKPVRFFDPKNGARAADR